MYNWCYTWDHELDQYNLAAFIDENKVHKENWWSIYESKDELSEHTLPLRKEIEEYIGPVEYMGVWDYYEGFVDDLGPHKEFAAHPALLHTEAFDPIIDVELLPGDILYLPPGYPHDGVTIEPSMSFSVGYRTASAKDMISAMADHIIDKDMCNEQIADPDRVLSENSGVVNNGDLERIKQQLFATLDDKLVSEFSGRYLTQSKCELDLPEECLGFQSLDVTEQLKQQPLIKLGGLRTLYFEASVADGVLYINGEQFTLSASREAFIGLLCDTQELTAENLSPWLEDSEVVEQLTAWVNAGYWYFDDID